MCGAFELGCSLRWLAGSDGGLRTDESTRRLRGGLISAGGAKIGLDVAAARLLCAAITPEAPVGLPYGFCGNDREDHDLICGGEEAFVENRAVEPLIGVKVEVIGEVKYESESDEPPLTRRAILGEAKWGEAQARRDMFSENVADVGEAFWEVSRSIWLILFCCQPLLTLSIA